MQTKYVLWATGLLMACLLAQGCNERLVKSSGTSDMPRQDEAESAAAVNDNGEAGTQTSNPAADKVGEEGVEEYWYNLSKSDRDALEEEGYDLDSLKKVMSGGTREALHSFIAERLQDQVH